MQLDDVLKLDIKILVAFMTIMEEGSASRAAKRLGVTQPALSKNLQKLRELFKDPLFTRQAYGLSPTAKAVELSNQIHPILSSLSELMTPSVLDLKTLQRRFCLRVDEGDLENFIEPLLASLHDDAPGLRLSISGWGEESQFEDLMSGTADLGIMRITNTPGNIRSKLIGYMEACIILSESHPLFHRDEISLEELLQNRTVTHHLRNHQESTFQNTANKLKQKGYDIEPSLETDSLMVAMQAVKRGMALVAPRPIGKLFTDVICDQKNTYPTKVLPIPKEVIEVDEYNGRHPIHIFWHERSNNDLAHRWLRENIIRFMRECPWMHLPD
ncbi:LysR family transcriptional regulator [Marinomonas pollencensis]|uniref:DNA-binding transcriptional LysR family regulator n=1 Tax=Marinomonas pollencensis TaxID=491954 RepID=A0A3E0DA29_9GAMM|nr:LysR family transcriptional regulator [Marinomonas pollencensis]REG79530.1 DNA-binding transcriptional LysR family regulator [Marinomonas pollencensis]